MSDISKAFKENDLTCKLLNALPCGILVITEGGSVVRLNDDKRRVVTRGMSNQPKRETDTQLGVRFDLRFK